MLSLYGFALSWSREFNLLGHSFSRKCSLFSMYQEFERSFLNKPLTTKHTPVLLCSSSPESDKTEQFYWFQQDPDVTSSPRRQISAAFWQPWIPTSRSRVCTTSIGWTCTPSTIWASFPRTFSLWLTNATAASGNVMTASVCSSGQCQTWWNKCGWFRLWRKWGLIHFWFQRYIPSGRITSLQQYGGLNHTVHICSVYNLSACETLVLSKLADIPNCPGQLAWHSCWG